MNTLYNKHVAVVMLILAMVIMITLSSCKRTPLEDQAITFIQQSCGETSAMVNCNSQLP